MNRVLFTPRFSVERNHWQSTMEIWNSLKINRGGVPATLPFAGQFSPKFPGLPRILAFHANDWMACSPFKCHVLKSFLIGWTLPVFSLSWAQLHPVASTGAFFAIDFFLEAWNLIFQYVEWKGTVHTLYCFYLDWCIHLRIVALSFLPAAFTALSM